MRWAASSDHETLVASVYRTQIEIECGVSRNAVCTGLTPHVGSAATCNTYWELRRQVQSSSDATSLRQVAIDVMAGVELYM